MSQEVVRRLQPQQPSSSMPSRDYGLTNPGDLGRLGLHGTGEHVQLTECEMFSQVHDLLYTNMHQVFTFRGRTTHIISYAKQHFQDHEAQRLAHRIYDLIELMAK